MKSIINDISHFMVFVPGTMLLLFRLKLSSFYKKYRGEENINIFIRFDKLFRTGYSPFFKLEANNNDEIQDVQDIMNWKKAIDISFAVAFSLFFLNLFLNK